jgi:hypothetical protein
MKFGRIAVLHQRTLWSAIFVPDSRDRLRLTRRSLRICLIGIGWPGLQAFG